MIMKSKGSQTLWMEIGRLIVYFSIVFFGVFTVAKNKLSVDSFWYSASYYFLEISSLLFILFIISLFRFGVSSIDDPIIFWRERGFKASNNDEDYYDLFDDFFIKYYSSEDIKNRVSDAFYFIIVLLDAFAVVVTWIIYFQFTDTDVYIITPASFLPQIFLFFYFIFSTPIYLLCKVITNRYPGEAMKARKTESHLSLHK